MSATQELIAAALSAADTLDEISKRHAGCNHAQTDELREACARAMVQPVGEVKAVEGIPIPTGHAEADRIIGRLMSSDPDFQDCTDAAALIQREICGPDGFATWREAALAERIKRTA